MIDIPPSDAPLTVSALSGALKRTVEGAFGNVRVRGEIGAFKRHTSGHCYFSLKDSGALIDAVLWSSSFSRLSFKPEEGMEVIATGKVTTYAERSKYQLVVQRMEPAGIGALLAQLEERKKRLAAEGLFDLARKRPIPLLPRCIAVITSPTGAVIRDILHRVRERCPCRVLVIATAVQGVNAAAEIAAALRRLGQARLDPELTPDTVIVARGGGSLEDLLPFSDEAVVRAAAALGIPLISAIGHETDTSLLDYVADLRAPTPTAAAEAAVPVRADLQVRVRAAQARMAQSAARNLAEHQARLNAVRLPTSADDAYAAPRQRLDRLADALRHAAQRSLQRFVVPNTVSPTLLLRDIARRTQTLTHQAERLRTLTLARLSAADDAHRRRLNLLEALSYKATLQRGYALVQDAAGKALTSAAAIRTQDVVHLCLHDGSVTLRPDARDQ